MLFGLIGCEINFSQLDPRAVGWGLICLAIALSVSKKWRLLVSALCKITINVKRQIFFASQFRILTSFVVVMGAGLTIKERLFVAMAWLPKATVQVKAR